MIDEKKNEALEAEVEYRTAVEEAYDYVENFDILETITNVGNDEVFTPRKTADMMLDSLPEEVWHNPNYKWLNPATKNGIFEREIAIRLDKGLEEAIPDVETRRKHILQNMIFSIGQTKFTSNVARRTVYYCSQANRQCDGIKAPDGHFVNGYAIGNGSWFDDEEGNIKTPCTNHEFVDTNGKIMPSNCSGEDRKKYKCRYCGISGDSSYNNYKEIIKNGRRVDAIVTRVYPDGSAYNDKNQRETYAYEFIHYHHLNVQRKLQDRFFKGDRTMKFDIIIGNPPYQLSTNDNGIQATPIYNKFVEQAIKLNPRYLSMIIPSRWFTGGMGMDSFRSLMLNDHRIRMLYDFPKSRDCFPNVDIAGGVCYFLWDQKYDGMCKVINSVSGKTNEKIRFLNDHNVLVRSNIGIGIIEKIKKVSKQFLDSVVYPISPFGLPTNTTGSEKPFNNSIKVIASKGELYIDKKDLPKGLEILNHYKVSIGQLNPDRGGVNNASDGMSNVTTKIKIYGPNEVFTATYLLLGDFETEEEANNFASYIKTRFVRYLVLLTLSSMHITKDNFMFVPKVDFNKKWSDPELYSMFGLNEKEINDIETSIREMA